jgi:hypothetical protein
MSFVAGGRGDPRRAGFRVGAGRDPFGDPDRGLVAGPGSERDRDPSPLPSARRPPGAAAGLFPGSQAALRRLIVASSVVCLKNSTVRRRSMRMFYYWGWLAGCSEVRIRTARLAVGDGGAAWGTGDLGESFRHAAGS